MDTQISSLVCVLCVRGGGDPGGKNLSVDSSGWALLRGCSSLWPQQSRGFCKPLCSVAITSLEGGVRGLRPGSWLFYRNVWNSSKQKKLKPLEKGNKAFSELSFIQQETEPPSAPS